MSLSLYLVQENSSFYWTVWRLLAGWTHSQQNTLEVSPTGTFLLLTSIITETWNWEITFHRIGQCHIWQRRRFFFFPARSAEDVHDTLWGFHFTVPSLNSSQWSGECPGEVDNFSIGIVLFTSAGMWRCICISFLLVSHSVGLHRHTVRWGQRSEPTMRSAPLRKGRIKEVYVFETVPHGNSTLWWRAKKIWVPIFLLISGKIWIPLSHLNSALLLLLFCIRVVLIEWGSEKLGRTVNTPVIIRTQTSSSGGFNYQSGASEQHHWAQGSK